MNDTDFTFHELEVKIRKISIGKKKLSKSIFNQIEYRDCFNDSMDFVGESILGYVKDRDSRYLLWVTNGMLRKTSLDKYYRLSESLEFQKVGEAEWFLKKVNIELPYFEHDEPLNRVLSYVDSEQYITCIKKTKTFLKKLINMQIYL